MKFAAIDIGSNAIRLLIENVYETQKGPVFHKDSMIRIPVRLGEDAFLDGVISEEKVEMVVKTMIAMKHIIDVHKVIDYKVVATSAMREAKNSAEIIERVKSATGLQIQVISGDSEGKTIMELPLEQSGMEPNEYYLYIDVGGGSTELALLGQLVNKTPVRIVKNKTTIQIDQLSQGLYLFKLIGDNNSFGYGKFIVK